MTQADFRHIFETSKTIAVVGLSDKKERPSYQVASYLKEKGFRIIPVNPTITTTLGEKSYPTLADIGEKVDVVDIFRKSELVPEIVEDAIKISAKAVWMQEGVVNEEAAKRAREAGLTAVMDACMMKEHKKLLGKGGEVMKLEDFAYIVETNKSFDEATVSVLKAVEQKGWSLFQIYDLKERLGAKGFTQAPLKIIEICSGKYANQFLNKNRYISLCLPCKINVLEEDGKVKIVGMKPTMISQFFPEVEKGEAEEAERMVAEIIDTAK